MLGKSMEKSGKSSFIMKMFVVLLMIVFLGAYVIPYSSAYAEEEELPENTSVDPTEIASEEPEGFDEIVSEELLEPAAPAPEIQAALTVEKPEAAYDESIEFFIYDFDTPVLFDLTPYAGFDGFVEEDTTTLNAMDFGFMSILASSAGIESWPDFSYILPANPGNDYIYVIIGTSTGSDAGRSFTLVTITVVHGPKTPPVTSPLPGTTDWNNHSKTANLTWSYTNDDDAEIILTIKDYDGNAIPDLLVDPFNNTVIFEFKIYPSPGATGGAFSFAIAHGNEIKYIGTGSGNIDIPIYKTLTLSYDGNAIDVKGVPGLYSEEVNYVGVSTVYKNITISNIIPTRPGYTFQGWERKDTSSQILNHPDQIRLDGNIILYAMWKAIPYTVTYTCGSHGTFVDQNYPGKIYNDPMPGFAGNPAGEPGWSFTGWSPAVADRVTGDVVYIAQWTPIKEPAPPLPPPGPDPNPGPDPGPDPNPGPDPGPAPGPAPDAANPPANPPVNPPVTPAVIVQDADDDEASIDIKVVSPQVIVMPEEPPLGPAEIKPERPPLADFNTWAVLNLILTAATGSIMVLLLVAYFVKRRDEENKKYPGLRLLTIAATVVSIVLFYKTEDMSLPMGIVDSNTIWHIIILVAALVLAILSRKTYEEETVTGAYGTSNII